MVWNSKSKDLALAKIVPHPNRDPNVIGRSPAITSMTFTPMALFGAAARCSHLHAVNPALVTPESIMMAALLEQHVDNSSNDFAILSSADNFKDFIKSYFAGTVAAGVAYLAMINDGYVWSDHFENFGGGYSGTKKTPDFVFAGFGNGIALMESKGSRGATSSAFDTTVNDGYTDQVEPHLGFHVGGTMATHGFCIGAYLKSTTMAELRVHHTAVPVAGTGGGVDPASTNNVQRHSYATAFRLAHSERLGAQIRSGEGPGRIPSGGGPDRIPFVRFEWRGRKWLSSYVVDGVGYDLGHDLGHFMDHFHEVERWPPRWVSGPSFSFAVEENIALEALRHFLTAEGREGRPLEVTPLPIAGEAEFTSRDTSEGAAFPDGLAVLSRDAKTQNVRPFFWERRGNKLSPA